MSPVVVPLTSTGVSTATLVQRVRWLLDDYPMQGHITASCTDSATTIYVDAANKWDNGVRLEFDDGTGEQAVIGSTASLSLTSLRRGAYGTTAAAHDSGVYLLREPRFGYTQISQALSQVATGWFAGQLWTQTTTTLTPSTTTQFYEVPDDFIGWITVSQVNTQATSQTDFGTRGSGLPVLVKRGVNSSLASSGIALVIPTIANTTEDIDLVYGASVTATTVEEGPAAAACVHGACALLLGAKDVPRTSNDVTQGDSSNQPGSTLRTAGWFYQQYAQYVRQARLELLKAGRLHRT